MKYLSTEKKNEVTVATQVKFKTSYSIQKPLTNQKKISGYAFIKSAGTNSFTQYYLRSRDRLVPVIIAAGRASPVALKVCYLHSTMRSFLKNTWESPIKFTVRYFFTNNNYEIFVHKPSQCCNINLRKSSSGEHYANRDEWPICHCLISKHKNIKTDL